ncbi:hypothetical protein HD553DRAFT_299171 [Filobasidium floriforme]|uniref:uncharacterized protein n=1 Tax=Filobasidium floriforme TaxID=5210 RepID=UPI001E8DEDD5|nr:uncharacterized protein HD553DRAFT_299171 [Filobasidium floriforme]KAH8081224.1 hypothetical protein HD553DRAFT_299171 [Filobasidium floriforme]
MPPINSLRTLRSSPSLRSTYRPTIYLCASRPLSSEASRIDKSKLDEPKIYRSNSLDPYFNLSFEDWLFRKTPNSTPTLLFYRNRSCVVIGKNQNPWKETNPDLLERDGIPLIRRRSGGGTVYHDEGNINFSILIPRHLFTRSLGSGIIETALKDRLEIGRAGVNERGDLILWDKDDGNRNKASSGESERIDESRSGQDRKWKKISGSAYKIVAQRAYHHGTMLISSDLGSLGTYLRSKSPDLITKSVDSVRSPVTTLRSARPDVTHDDFVHAVAEEFHRVFSKVAEEALAPDFDRGVIEQIDEEALKGGAERSKYIEQGISELKSWDWTYGSTPEFYRDLHVNLPSGATHLRITSKHALVTHVEALTQDNSTQTQEAIETLRSRLLGRTYGHSQEGDFDQLVNQAISDIHGTLS